MSTSRLGDWYAFDLADSPELSLLELSLRLAWTPIVARRTFPVDATCKRFGVEPPRRDWWRNRKPISSIEVF
jgi:hypothetical protein